MDTLVQTNVTVPGVKVTDKGQLPQRMSKRDLDKMQSSASRRFGIQPVYPDRAAYDAIHEGRAEYSVYGALAQAIKAVYGGANGKYLDKSRPFGFVRSYDWAALGEIVSDVLGDWWVRRCEEPSEGNMTCRFSFGIAAAKADKRRNQGKGYWTIKLVGVRDGGDGIPEYIPMDRSIASEWRKTRRVMGYSDVREERIGVRSFGDARIAALASGVKNDMPLSFADIDNRNMLERMADESLEDVAALQEIAKYLTPTESSVLTGLAKGLSMKQVAEDMGITRPSVSDTFARAASKIRKMVESDPDKWDVLADMITA